MVFHTVVYSVMSRILFIGLKLHSQCLVLMNEPARTQDLGYVTEEKVRKLS